MSPKRHSISDLLTSKKIKTPLKASVVLLTSMILASCVTNDDPAYIFQNIFPPVTPTTTPNLPEAVNTGAQALNIDASELTGNVFKTTTRDFTTNEDGSVVNARADIASGGALPVVSINTSGTGDTATQNGFKAHNDITDIDAQAIGAVLPLTYTSVYKDFGNDLRIGHINGSADADGLLVPVDGVAVIGNATQVANMPTAGTAKYTGDATYRQIGLDKAIEYGSSVFNADFVAKKVAGDLTFANAGNINLKANIDGNKFSGAAADNAGYNTEGGFYGGDAQYLGGIYEGNNAQGTFGAEKQ